jgi:hypothetical protein
MFVPDDDTAYSWVSASYAAVPGMATPPMSPCCSKTPTCHEASAPRADVIAPRAKAQHTEGSRPRWEDSIARVSEGMLMGVLLL